MESKHTPGPWTYDEDHNIESPTGRVVSVGWTGYAGESGSGEIYEEADARLIAAAPDLLEALKAVRDECMGYVPNCANIIDAAIAKAEGLQP